MSISKALFLALPAMATRLERRSVLGALCCAAHLLLAGASQAAAETAEGLQTFACAKPEPGDELLPQEPIGRTETVPVGLGPHKLLIPWSYFALRPTRAGLDCYEEAEEVNIQFWIPSLDAPERGLFWRPEFRPSETNRPHPGPDEHVIKMTLQVYGPGHLIEHADADLRIANVLRRIDGAPIEQYGLQTAGGSAPEGGPPRWFRQSDQESLFIWCLSAKSDSACQASLDLKDWGVAVWMLMKRDAVPHNQIITRGLRTLLARWNALPN